jgi:1-acyl-sn-glycerol-3-phosphate acyltransferase
MAEQVHPAPATQACDEEQLAGIVRDLVAEVHPGGARLPVRLDSRLGADLGLDSLAVVELRSRMEQAFGLLLPDRILDGSTLADWLAVLRAAGGSTGRLISTGRAAVPGPAPVPVLPATFSEPTGAGTLLEALAWHVQAHPARPCVRLLDFTAGEPAQQEVSYARLSADAVAVAHGLRRGGLAPGAAVAIMLPTGRDFFASFLGTLLAGGVAVPIYPPARRAGLEEHLHRQAGILRGALATVLITVPGARVLGRLLRSQVPSLRQVATAGELSQGPAGGALPEATADDIALLQYTSGSTGDPKGVVLAHRHLLANIRAMGTAADAGPGDLFVSWLPLYHDMGLIGAWLAGLYYGFPLAVMSPLDFLARPARWLRVLSEQHATLSGAPNFGYELCLRQISDRDLAGVDTLPRLRARWAVLRTAAWLLRHLLGIPLTVTGQAPEGGPFVMAANHGSFIDGLVLVLCLPDPVCFAVAEKFATGRITGLFLRRIGAQFVPRAQPQQAAASTAQLADVLARGRSLAIWPEGALDAAPGLRPFHLGAFEAAAATGTPVIPAGIRGSRELLRPGRRFPHRTALHVAITDPIPPAGTGWHAALALRDQARAAILALSGEPDTGGQ